MLGIAFLKREGPLELVKYRGAEFLDLQKGTFYDGLTKLIRSCIELEQMEDDDFPTPKLVMTNAENKALTAYILAETGILINFDVDTQISNASVDSGFIYPGSFFNVAMAEKLLNEKHTSVFRAFQHLKVDVLKGWVDTKTGRVEGDFSKIPFNMSMQPYLDYWVVSKSFAKLNLSYAEAVAGTICHELGHIFGGFYQITQVALSTYIPRVAATAYMNADTDTKKAVVLKEVSEVLEVAERIKIDKLVEDLKSEEDVLLYISKAVANRDLRRTLSLGIVERSKETYADIYAYKMGAGKGLIAALGAGVTGIGVWGWVCWTLVPIAIGLAPIGAMFGGLFVVVNAMTTFENLVPKEVYDTPYRRAKGILREYAADIGRNKELSSGQKAKLLKDAKQIEAFVTEEKSVFESTAVQRLFGWLKSGSDFKAQEFEHYTQEVLSHNLNLYIDHFKSEEK